MLTALQPSSLMATAQRVPRNPTKKIEHQLTAPPADLHFQILTPAIAEPVFDYSFADFPDCAEKSNSESTSQHGSTTSKTSSMNDAGHSITKAAQNGQYVPNGSGNETSTQNGSNMSSNAAHSNTKTSPQNESYTVAYIASGISFSSTENATCTPTLDAQLNLESRTEPCTYGLKSFKAYI